MKKMTNWKKIFVIHIMEKGLILLRNKWFFNEEGKVGNLTEKCAKTQSNTSQNQMHKRPLIIWNKPFHTQLMKIHNDRSLLGVCVCGGGGGVLWQDLTKLHVHLSCGPAISQQESNPKITYNNMKKHLHNVIHCSLICNGEILERM